LPSPDDPRNPEIEIDLEVARPTRVSAYTHGGDAHFEVDRRVAERLYATHPAGIEAFRAVGKATQDFLERVVRHLATEAGTRQFLVIGSSISGRRNVHEVARDVEPDVRTVYVLFDPVQLVYAHRLLRDHPEGTVAYVQARMRDVDEIMQQAADTLDLSLPVGLLMPSNLSFVRDLDKAAELVDRYMAPLAPGSHLMVTLHASDLYPEQTAPVFEAIHELTAKGGGWDIAPRSRDEVTEVLDRLELLPPGVVPVQEWRPDVPRTKPARVAVHGALARKP
jgi:S-adenosyl methyltransferase